MGRLGIPRPSRSPGADAPAEAGPPDGPTAPVGPRLARIHEVATATGLTPRSIRYYEEMGLLRPAARSQGDYRLYDESDVERLRFIRDLRDDAGFSLAEIGRLLEDEDARIRDAERFRSSGDTAEQRAIVGDLIDRADRQVATLAAKVTRLQAMIEAAIDRRRHLLAHLAELEGGEPAHAPGGDGAGRPARRGRR